MTMIESALMESMKMEQFLGVMREDFSFIDILADNKPQMKGDSNNG